MKSKERVRHPGILLIYVEKKKKKLSMSQAQLSHSSGSSTSCDLPGEIFIVRFFPAHKTELANLKRSW